MTKAAPTSLPVAVDDTLPSGNLSHTRLLRVSLGSVLISMAAVAIWISTILLYREKLHLLAEVGNLRKVTRELIIASPEGVSIAQGPPNRNSAVWEVYIPTRPAYDICLATEMASASEFAEPIASAPLPPGRHWITLVRSTGVASTSFGVLVDGRESLAATRSDYHRPGLSAIGSSVGDSESHDAGQPVAILRERYWIATPGSVQPPDGPADGILLWLKPR